MSAQPGTGPGATPAGIAVGNAAGVEARDTFTAAWGSVAPVILAWCGLRIGPALRRRLDPEDLLQEICCRAWMAYPRFEPARAPFRSWVFGIARNVLREALLAAGRAGPAASAPPQDGSTRSPLDAVPADATSISRRAAKDEVLVRVRAAIDALDAEEKKLLLYRGFEGLTHPEVGARLGLDSDAAAKRWQRLRDKFAAGPLGSEIAALF